MWHRWKIAVRMLPVLWVALCVTTVFAQDTSARSLDELFDASLLGNLPDSAGAASLTIQVAPPGEDDDEELPRSSLTLILTNRGKALDEAERAKFYVYDPGDREDLVAWGHAARTAEFPGGTYDVIVRYEHDAIEKEIGFANVALIGDILHSVDFDVVEASLTVVVTNGGRAIEAYAGSYTVRQRGRRGGDPARKRPGETITVEPGTYDVEIRYRDAEGLKTTVLENHRVEGHMVENIEIGIPLAHLSVTLTTDGERIPPGEGQWRIYKPGQRNAWLAERRSGELLGIEAGTYDIGAFVERDGIVSERWVVGLELQDERHERVDMGTPRHSLRVNVNRGGRLLEDAWFSVYPAGDRKTPIVSAPSGAEVELEKGDYDIGCFLRADGMRVDRWIDRRQVTGVEQVDVELETRPAFLRVLPRGTGGNRRSSDDGGLLIIVDSSAGMRARVGNASHMEVVLSALGEFFRDNATADFEVGLRVFGAAIGGQRDCSDSQLLVSLAGYDRGALTTALDQLRPNGRAPLAYSLEQAEFDFAGEDGGSIAIITSGAEGCGGDPCAVASRLVREGKAENLSVIGFGVDRDQMRQLDCIGRPFIAGTAGELKSALREVVRDARRNDGRVTMFDTQSGVRVAGGFLGDKIQVGEGRYDIVIHTRGKSYEWPDIPIVGNVEVVASKRPPVFR